MLSVKHLNKKFGKNTVLKDISFDVNEKRRNLRRNLRNIKYKYIENRFKINIGICAFIIILCFGIYYFGFYIKNNIKEGTLITSNGVNYTVNGSYFSNP